MGWVKTFCFSCFKEFLEKNASIYFPEMGVQISDLLVFDTFCDPGEPSKREGEEGKRSWTVSRSEESEHMSRCMLRATLKTSLVFFLKRKLSILGLICGQQKIIMHAL